MYKAKYSAPRETNFCFSSQKSIVAPPSPPSDFLLSISVFSLYRHFASYCEYRISCRTAFVQACVIHHGGWSLLVFLMRAKFAFDLFGGKFWNTALFHKNKHFDELRKHKRFVNQSQEPTSYA